MSRMEEWSALLAECDREVPGLEGTLDRAYAKRRKKRAHLALKSLGSIAACFALFVILVNFSAPVANACSRIPGLRELAKVVTFSRSLKDAVDHEFVQPVELSQSNDDISAEIAYLIVDQKQVNVFYQLDCRPDIYTLVWVDVYDTEGKPLDCGIYYHQFEPENVDLRSFTIDFFEQQVPEQLLCVLKIGTPVVYTDGLPPATERFPDPDDREEPEVVAEFEFLLELDSQFTAAAKLYPVNQLVEIDGQTFTIPEIEVYPSHLRLNVLESEDNSARIRDLDFYLETDTGIRFDTSSGITAHSTADNRYLTSYRAESTYFYEAKELKLVITGARLLDKDRARLHLNLLTGETDPLPEGISFQEAYREGEDWIISFRADFEFKQDEIMRQLFGSRCYDSHGNLYEVTHWSSIMGEPDETGRIPYYFETFPLKGYPYDEVWLSPQFTHNWTPETPIEITITLE